MTMNFILEIQFNDTLFKIHGSLGKAGWVRMNTPHVDRQEKLKKRKTGRARRRQKYNQRFNVKKEDGSKRPRGPNSNRTY